jgi:regulator of RNase E activity RraA
VIVGDADGVIVIPFEIVADVVDAAIAQEAEDAWIADRVAEGSGVDGLFPLSGQWRERYDAEQSGQS